MMLGPAFFQFVCCHQRWIVVNAIRSQFRNVRPLCMPTCTGASLAENQIRALRGAR